MPRLFEFIAPPEIVRRSTREDVGERRISNRITPAPGSFNGEGAIAPTTAHLRRETANGAGA